MEDSLRWKTTFDGRRPSMEDDLYIAGRNTALDIFCFAVFFLKQNKSRNICNFVGVSWVSGKVSEGCLRSVWKVPRSCLKGVLKVPVVWFPVVYKESF